METSEYDHSAIEAQVRGLWEERDIYRYDPTAAGPVFSIDTPPPYVSASHLHVGHAMSYSQPDFIVRYRRMRGERIFYPMGFDDNGLPTERYVEQKYNIKAAETPRAEFVQLCLDETKETAQRYEDIWRRLGLSVDWSLVYSTIDSRSQRTAQTSFLKLHEAGLVTRRNDPIIWCPECQTSLAQADVEDLERNGQLHRIAFTSGKDGRELVIATTRPELLPGCVALYANPDDDRYRDLVGTTAKVPLFHYPVPIKSDHAVDPNFGTGLMMVCTFGDAEDVVKWRQDGLDLRLVVESDGRLGSLAGPVAGKKLAEARKIVLSMLDELGALRGSTSTRQVVGVHERCLTPVEFQIKPQWFINVQEHRDRFRARAAELTWVPEFMKRRLDDWIDGLKWDWNISRQRHYGVPFPVWYCSNGHAILPQLDQLPVDPLSDQVPVTSCPQCEDSEIIPERDVMDTWMTSSLSPQINNGWALHNLEENPAITPMSMRVQAFEIIRTWLFYTVVQSEFHCGRIPWQTVMISGWGLNEQGVKIAKRDLAKSTAADGFNRYVPDHVIEKYGADALRLWATSARIGHDLRYHEKDIRVGRKFAVKLWNVGRFLRMNLADFDPETATRVELSERSAVDRWVLSHLADTVHQVTAALDAFDTMQAYKTASRFFWSIYCDRYIEMIKDRFLDAERSSAEDRLSAQWTMWETYRVLLGLFAPFAPFTTEHLFQEFYAERESVVSIHVSAWPVADPQWENDRSEIDQLVTILDAVRTLRSRARLSANTRISKLVLEAKNSDNQSLIAAIAEPLRVAARANEVVFASADYESGVDGVFLNIVH